MIDLNKYIVDPEPKKTFHSSGYADVASVNALGSASPVSFEERRKLERCRSTVGSYNRSIIGQTYGVQRAKSIAPGATTLGSIPLSSPRGPMPPGRTYNPYA